MNPRINSEICLFSSSKVRAEIESWSVLATYNNPFIKMTSWVFSSGVLNLFEKNNK